MLTYTEMYRDLFSLALELGNDTMLALLNEWFDLDSEVMPLTSGQTKRLVYLGDYVRNQWYAYFS